MESNIDQEFKRIAAHVDTVYVLKDNYLLPKEERLTKLKEATQEIINDLSKIDESVLGAKQKAYLLYLQGKVWNAFPTYEKQAETQLSKSVRIIQFQNH
jgi:hypothetical protein